MEAKITKFNFILSLTSDEGQDLKIYVPQPNEIEIRGIAKLLSVIFDKVTKNENPLVIMKDYDVYVDDLFDDATKKTAFNAKLNAFFERSLLSASVYTETGEKIERKLSEDETEIFKGSLLFAAALYRYSTRTLLSGTDMRAFYTSLTATEFQNSLKTSSKPA